MNRRLSHWGWGFEDRFPDLETREMFAQQVRLLMQLEQQLEIQDPVPLEDATLPKSRLDVSDKWLTSIASTGSYDRASRCYGRAYRDIVRGFAGDFGAAPDVVLKPVDEAQVQIAVDWAVKNDIALVPYGGGTSVVGGVEVEARELYSGVACLDLRGLDRVLEIDELSASARIQAARPGRASKSSSASATSRSASSLSPSSSRRSAAGSRPARAVTSPPCSRTSTTSCSRRACSPRAVCSSRAGSPRPAPARAPIASCSDPRGPSV